MQSINTQPLAPAPERGHNQALVEMAPVPAATLARPDWLDASHFPFTSRTIALDGADVHYVDEGDGPVLLFLHGLPAYSFLYRHFIRRLRHRYRTIALDLPGFGLSRAAAGYGYGAVDHARVVEQFLLALDLHDVTLVVHDSGGPIGLGVAGRHPERFKALAITNTFAWPLDDYPAVRRFVRFTGSSLFAFFNVNFNFLPRLFTTFAPLSPAAKIAYLGPFRRKQARPAMHLLFRSLGREAGYLRQVEAGLDRLKQLPVLLMWGSGDSTHQAGFVERFEQIFANHRTLIVHEGNAATGHFPQEYEPDKMIAALDDWWQAEVAL